MSVMGGRMDYIGLDTHDRFTTCCKEICQALYFHDTVINWHIPMTYSRQEIESSGNAHFK